MIHDILKMGDPRLLRKAEPVFEFNTPELDQLIADLFATMEGANGAGIAAPQIGINLRVVVFEVTRNPRYPDAEPVPRTVLINPRIEALSEDKEEDWEGCLSVPDMRGMVPRYTYIRYSGHDHKGEIIDREVTDFHARVVQHECDHLDGVLYPARIQDMSKFGFTDALQDAGVLNFPTDAE
ncbi:MAG: peptide deformylase [Pseudomonadota bacterium]